MSELAEKFCREWLAKKCDTLEPFAKSRFDEKPTTKGLSVSVQSWWRPSRIFLAIAYALGVCAVIWCLLDFIANMTTPILSDQWLDVRDILLVVSLIGLSAISYVAWPSRWNVLAHAQVAFGLVAFVLPVLVLKLHYNFPPQVLNLYSQVVMLGFVFSLIGAVTGAWIASVRSGGTAAEKVRAGSGPEGFAGAISFDGDSRQENVRRRVELAVVASLIGLLACFIVMGFVPALADNPFAAKFFKGSYAEPYARVAPLYRLVTTFLALLTPIVTVYAWVRRDFKWVMYLCLSLVGLLLTLQRGPALTGILLFLGILIASSKRSMIPYFFALIGVYVAGSGFYYALGILGVREYSSLVSGTTGLVESIAAGAPDVVDQLTFLQYWLSNPEYTYGRTFLGGLVPGNFEWNPAVWGLHITNPGVLISSINSGGYRLPAPLWGLVSFSWPGVIGVSFFSGLLIGVVTGVAKQRVRVGSIETSVLRYVVYGAVLASANFYVLGYLDLISLLLLWFILRAQSSNVPLASLSRANRQHQSIPPVRRT